MSVHPAVYEGDVCAISSLGLLQKASRNSEAQLDVWSSIFLPLKINPSLLLPILRNSSQQAVLFSHPSKALPMSAPC